MPPTVSFDAVDCPQPAVASGILDHLDDAVDPLVAVKMIQFSSGPGSSTTPVNGNAKLLDELGRYGGGAIAPAMGLSVSAGAGASALINTGILAGLGAPIQVVTPIAKPCANGRIHLWMSHTADVQAVVDPDLLPPGPEYGYLGSAIMVAGAFDHWDKSGRAELINNLLVRETADAGAPGDVLDARLRLWTRCPGGLYLWDGAAHQRLDNAAVIANFVKLFALTALSSGDSVNNTALETAFTEPVTLLADSLSVGDVLRVQARGVYSNSAGAPGNLQLRAKVGTVVIADTGVVTLGTAADRGWSLDLLVVVTAVGASGQVEAQGDARLSTSAVAAIIADLEAAAGYGIDTTVDHDLTLTAQWSVADAGNIVTMRQLVVERLR